MTKPIADKPSWTTKIDLSKPKDSKKRMNITFKKNCRRIYLTENFKHLQVVDSIVEI